MPSAWTERVRGTLAFRLAFWYAALFVVSTSLLFAVTYVVLAGSLRRRDREVVRSMLADCVSAYQSGGLDGVRRTLTAVDQLGAHAGLVVRVVSGGEEVLFMSTSRASDEFPLDELSTPSGGEGWGRVRSRRGDAVLEVASALLSDGTLVQAGRSSAEREELLSRFRGILVAVAALTLAAGVIGGALLTHWSLRPLRDLTRTVRRIIDTGQLTARVPTRSTRDPLDELAGLQNRMLDRIASLVGAMRESLDNVAHDLRTPLARLRGSAERALAAPSEVDAARDALADCLEESEQVLGLLETLMDVAEAEAGALRLQREPVDVREVVARVVDLYADLAEDKGVSLHADAPAEALEVTGDHHRLTQAVANVVDNAVKYTPAGGRVVIDASRRDGMVAITVSDTGPGIPAEDMPRVFERLFRGDRSRTERGLGLGLSLARAVIVSHQGRIAVDSAPGSGSRFTILLPAGISNL